MGWFNKKSFDKKNTNWLRKEGEIAIRVDATDIKSHWGTKPITIYDGTAALVFSKGELLGTLASGKHDIDGPIRKWLSADAPTVLILIDDGDINLDLDITSLYSKENISLDVSLSMTFQIDRPEMFYTNIMKELGSYTTEDLKKHLENELKDALLAFTSVHPIEDLYHNPTLKQETTIQMQHRIGQNFGRIGF
ncbi:MAG: SPFH domain-containing protein, partial [Phycisphaerales bacterium]|nr:SPFH domain-containing protein [Phycisphaerales bacterium]